MATSIPIVDLGPLLQQPQDDVTIALVAQQVDQACRDTGFLYVSGHGVQQQQITHLLGLAAALFDLPPGAKDGMDARRSQLARGYNSLQRGQHSCTPEDGQQDVKESFTLGVERAADDPRPASPMHGPNQWPPEQLLPGWRTEALAAFDTLLGVARLLMRALGLALRQPEDFFTSKCTDPVAQMVMFRYPPTGDAAGQRGCGAHTDCGFLTFVAQDAPGIEVQQRNGSWLSAPSLPGTFLVNLGDLAQRWTGDAYRSTVHRVVNRSSTDIRHSVVFFCNCDFDALVETIDAGATSGAAAAAAAPGSCGSSRNSAVTAGSAARGDSGSCKSYPPVKAGEYILQKLGLMYT